MDFYLSKDVGKENQERWHKARRSIFLVCCYEALLFGIELTILESTEYFYYKDVLKTPSYMVCYSLSLALNIAATLTANILTSFIVNRYQIYTDTILLLTFVSIMGHCLYFVTTTPAVIVFSRFMTGFARSTNIATHSYLQTLFSNEELTVKSAILSNFTTIGTVIGPVLTYLFVLININIGTLNLNYGNSPGFYMALCKLILFATAFFFLDDIPREKDCQIYAYSSKRRIENMCCICHNDEDKRESLLQNQDKQENKFSNENVSEIEDEFRREKPANRLRKIPVRDALRQILSVKHSLLIFLVLFLHGVTFKVINSLIPVESSKYLWWDIKQISALCLFNVVFGTVVSLIIACCFSNTTHYLNLIGGMVFGLFSLALLATVRHYGKHRLPGAVLFCFMSAFNVLSSCLVGLSVRMVLVHLTDKSLRSFTGAMRTCLLEVSYFFGSILILIVHENPEVSGYIGLTLTLFLIANVIYKLRHLWV